MREISPTQTIGGDGWAMDVAPGWSAQQDPECMTLVDDRDVGAFQISSARKVPGPATDAELLAAMRRMLNLAPVGAVSFGSFTGFAFAYVEKDVSWRVWHLRREDVLFFATYNCASADEGVHATDLEAMLSSLRAPAPRRPWWRLFR